MNKDTSLFGERTVAIRNLDMNNKEYESRKSGIVKRFFHTLASRASTRPLTELVDDPLDPGNKKERFYLECSPRSLHWRLRLLREYNLRDS